MALTAVCRAGAGMGRQVLSAVEAATDEEKVKALVGLDASIETLQEVLPRCAANNKARRPPARQPPTAAGTAPSSPGSPSIRDRPR